MQSGMGGLFRIPVLLGVSAGEEERPSEDLSVTALIDKGLL